MIMLTGEWCLKSAWRLWLDCTPKNAASTLCKALKNCRIFKMMVLKREAF